jgi:hypothetical protein
VLDGLWNSPLLLVGSGVFRHSPSIN